MTFKEMPTRKDMIKYFLERDEHYIFDNFALTQKGKLRKVIFIVVAACLFAAFLYYVFSRDLITGKIPILYVLLVVAGFAFIVSRLYASHYGESSHKDYTGVMLTSARVIDLQSYRSDDKMVYSIDDVVNIDVAEVSKHHADIQLILNNEQVLELGRVNYYQKVIDDIQAAIKKSKANQLGQ